MASIATALAPILALILIGFGLKQCGFLAETVWLGIEKLCYCILFPALLVATLGGQSLDGVPWADMLAVVVGTTLTAAAGLTAWHRMRRSVDGATFSSIFQGGVRFNTYIALAVAQAFFGAQGLTLAALAAGFMIVLVNVLCVFVLTTYRNETRGGRALFFREIAVNPLVLACVVGWLLSLSGVGLPGIIKVILEVVGRAALPLGLIAVGAALRPAAVAGHSRSIAVASIAQFGAKPVCALLLVSAVGLSSVAAAVVMVIMMVPTAPSAYILARQLGGNAEAMASIITFQTLLAFVAMPIIATLTIV